MPSWCTLLRIQSNLEVLLLTLWKLIEENFNLGDYLPECSLRLLNMHAMVKEVEERKKNDRKGDLWYGSD